MYNKKNKTYICHTKRVNTDNNNLINYMLCRKLLDISHR